MQRSINPQYALMLQASCCTLLWLAVGTRTQSAPWERSKRRSPIYQPSRWVLLSAASPSVRGNNSSCWEWIVHLSFETLSGIVSFLFNCCQTGAAAHGCPVMVEEPPSPTQLRIKAGTVVVTAIAAVSLLLYDWDSVAKGPTVFTAVRPALKKVFNRVYGVGDSVSSSKPSDSQ